MTFLLFTHFRPAWGSDHSRFSVFAYGGASTSASLLNILKVSIPDLGGYYMSTLGASWRFMEGKFAALEVEWHGSKHLESPTTFSTGGLLVLRWTKMPWDHVIPGSFAIGNGLSYSTDFLQAETNAITKTSKLLYHIVIEYEFRLGFQSSWSVFVRDHHRSGIFGIFDGVVGGSDFLCLGARYRFF